MNQVTRGITHMVRKMGSEISPAEETTMQGSSQTIEWMGLESFSGAVVNLTKGTGRIVKCMGRGNSFGLTVENMLVNTIWMLRKDMGYSHGQTGRYSKFLTIKYYEGYWLKGKQNGMGTFKTADGEKSGEWE